MTKLYAQPYDISARGFYFDSAEDYSAKAASNRNSFGGMFEEYEIQFIDGDDIDAALFDALHVHQGQIIDFFDAVDDWSDDEKVRVTIAAGEGDCRFDLSTDEPDRLEIDLYECGSLRALAEQFVDEGLFGDIPPSSHSLSRLRGHRPRSRRRLCRNHCWRNGICLPTSITARVAAGVQLSSRSIAMPT